MKDIGTNLLVPARTRDDIAPILTKIYGFEGSLFKYTCTFFIYVLRGARLARFFVFLRVLSQLWETPLGPEWESEC